MLPKSTKDKKTARRPAAVWPVPRQWVVQGRMLRMSLLARCRCHMGDGDCAR